MAEDGRSRSRVPSMDGAPARLLALATYLTTRTAAHAHRLVGEAFSATGARGYHYRVLSALAEFGPLSQADLGRRIDVDRSDIVTAVNELAAAGQVERKPDPADGRRNLVTITPAGREQLLRLDAALAQVQERFLAPLDDEERVTYRALLAKLLAHHAGRAT
jgi:Transcriptional regulators